ncbi:hypothetical protein ASC90_02360 [Rhizobium sp. Root1220]|nr:hypothetical protein ASC90_02360 [Rhizobium sp. Root1220]
MSVFQNLSLMVFLSLVPVGHLSAMPLAPVRQTASDPNLVKVQSTMCDYRGCFTFGPTQSFRPAYVQPNYRPPTATGPTYYRPSTQGQAPLYYDPPPVQNIRPKATNQRFHVDWCRNQYRSYNPKTDRFVTFEGIYKTCNSPYD